MPRLGHHEGIDFITPFGHSYSFCVPLSYFYKTVRLTMTRLAVIGLGAFGRLMLSHLKGHFDLLGCDPSLSGPEWNGVPLTDLHGCGAADVIVIAVPVQSIEVVAQDLAPHLKSGALVLDVGSVKVKPATILIQSLPAHVDIVCTHPLFGPQSAADGIKDLKVSVCPVRGERLPCVARFLSDKLGLNVIETTPERHDRELAYVQGLTHLIGQTLLGMKLETFDQTTVSYDLLARSVSFIKGDSAELFRAIELENPFAAEARQAFFDAVRKIEKGLEN
jgi:prephenate dehydrogenase